MLKSLFLGLFILVLAVILANIVWRFAVRRRSLPCPSWLVPLLENPYMRAVAGSSALLDRAAVERGMHILDVGCGPGRLALPAAERVAPSGLVTAMDIQAPMLRRLEARMAQRGLTNIRVVHAGAGDGVVEENSFDRAFLVTVLGEIPDRVGALREIQDALRPGGILSVTEVLPDPHYQGRATVRALAEEAGFRFERTFGGFPAFTMHFVKDAPAR